MIDVVETDSGRQLFFLSTADATLVVLVGDRRHVFVPYWGPRLDPCDVSYLVDDVPRASYLADADGAKDYKLEQLPQLYPSFGYTDLREPAFLLRQSNGSRTSDLKFESYRIAERKARLEGLPTVLDPSGAPAIEIALRDEVAGTRVVVTFGVFEEQNALTESVRIENDGEEPLVIEKVSSACVDLHRCDLDMIHLAGAWSREFGIVRRPVVQGAQSVGSARGTSGHGQNPFVALAARDADERHGEVYAMSFVYSGNFLAQADRDMHENVRLQMGINPFDFSWTLEPGETFQAPEVALVFSDRGLDGMSRAFHDLYRSCLMPRRFASAERPVLLNCWEACYFDYTREDLERIADGASQIGAELFVLDDGWFGKRNDSTSSVGDWVPNRQKIGGTIEDLAKSVEKRGLAFGLWFEPEAVSRDSDLYRAHPDWAIQAPGRMITTSRDEYLLDLSNPAVCDYLVETLSEILSTAPIAYVKWDMNRNVTNAGSEFLPSERQQEQAHRCVLGLYRVLETLVGRFPNVLFEGCAGGGGRCDPGMLAYMPQMWISDDTDALERLKIQYGASLVYPPIALGCHISDVPNHQTHRSESLRTRAIVAGWGNLGLEFDPARLDRDGIEAVAREVDAYRSIRATVQLGALHRLMGLDGGNEYAWMHVSEDGSRIVACYVCQRMTPNSVSHRLMLSYLEPAARYRVDGSDRVYSGAELMNVGLSLGKIREDAYALRWVIDRVG